MPVGTLALGSNAAFLDSPNQIGLCPSHSPRIASSTIKWRTAPGQENECGGSLLRHAARTKWPLEGAIAKLASLAPLGRAPGDPLS